LVGSLGVVNSTGIKELFSFSSISNTGWLVLALLLSSTAGLTYMVCYFSVGFTVTLYFGFFGPGSTFGTGPLSPWHTVSV